MCMVCGDFLDGLMTKGLLFDMGVPGLYGRSGTFEDVVERLTALITRLGADAKPEVLRFPPGMNRVDLERSGYLKNFPDMAGTIHSFKGGDREHAMLVDRLHANLDWTEHQAVNEVSLAPAACYPLYPVVSSPRRAAEGRRHLRHLLVLLPQRAVARPGPDADVPPARVCADRLARPGQGVPRALARARAGDDRDARAALASSRSPTTRSSAARGAC